MECSVLVVKCCNAAFSLKSWLSPSVYISMSACRELSSVTCSESCLHVGSQVTFTRLEASLHELISTLPRMNPHCLLLTQSLINAVNCLGHSDLFHQPAPCVSELEGH